MCQRRYIGLAVLVIALGYFGTSTASSLGGIEAFKVLSTYEGWAADPETLFWTEDAGKHWESRTPPGTNQAVVNVHFVTTSVGWVLLARADESHQIQFYVAATQDGGHTWTISHIEILDRITDDFSGQGSIFFVDRLHGWIDLNVTSSSAFRPGKMLRTDDGGTTWKEAIGQPGIAGSFCFFNPRDGMLTGGPADTELYVTHDGAETWQQLSLAAAEALPADFPTYGEPACAGQIGNIPVTYSGREGSSSALVVFETHDAGRTFRASTVVKSLKETAPGQKIMSAEGGTHLFTLSFAGNSILRTTSFRKNGNSLTQTSQVGGEHFSILGSNFYDASHGWALTSFALLSTSDGGATWSDITPNDRTPEVASLTRPEEIPPANSSDAIPFTNSSNVTASKNTRLGFDIGFVPKTAQMKSWWEGSPYYETSLYLPGAANKKADPNLNSAWLSTSIAQGWGFIPIWVGPQAPCVLQTGLKLISQTNPASQGQAEAVKAIAAAKAFSSSIGPVVYYNLENYDTSNSGCRMIVREFLNGWMSTLHAYSYKGGVYGNPAPAALDFSNVSPLPDDAWVSVVPLPAKPPNLSIWGLSTLCDPFAKTSCKLWSDSQRIHQYQINHTETWNGQSLTVDRNVVDADVAVPSTRAKPYAFQYVILDYPGATLTEPYGINNIGTVVGAYFDSANNQHGFTYRNGKYTSYDYPGALTTEIYSANDSGQSVGVYYNSSGLSGFLLSNSVSTSISLRKDFNNQPLAINDDGQLIGNYGTQNVSGVAQFFLMNTKNANKVTTVNCYCNVDSISGDGYVYGVQYPPSKPQTAFLYNTVSGGFTTLPKAPASGGASGAVNNSLQIVSLNVFYDYPSGTHITVEPAATYQSTSYANGLNDYGEIVGSWTDSKFSTHGYLACPTGFPLSCALP